MIFMKCFWTCGGSGDAPEMQTRMDVRLYSGSFGCASRAEYMVGTPQNTVTLCFCMVSRILVGSNFGVSTIFAAWVMGVVMLVVMP